MADPNAGTPKKILFRASFTPQAPPPLQYGIPAIQTPPPMMQALAPPRMAVAAVPPTQHVAPPVQVAAHLSHRAHAPLLGFPPPGTVRPPVAHNYNAGPRKIPKASKKFVESDDEEDDIEMDFEGDDDDEEETKPEKMAVDVEEDAALAEILQPPTLTDQATKSIDRIVAHRRRDDADALEAQNPDIKIEDTSEYLLKWKKQSFLHLNWVGADYLRAEGQGGRARLLKYWKHRASAVVQTDDDGEVLYFPADWTEVERVIGMADVPSLQGMVRMYMVKWAGLPYYECTWETREDIGDDAKIQQFHDFNAPIQVNPIAPPNPQDWRPLDKSPIYKDENTLRQYQLEGLNWLIFNWFQHRSCILADEMGLGKTIQAVTFLEWLFRVQQSRGPFLVIVPLSTIGHWQRQIEGWTGMNCITYQGNKRNRTVIREFEFYLPNKSDYKFNTLLTTYEMLMTDDWTELSRIKWKCLVIDEAQRLKNSTSKLNTNLKHFACDHRVLLTGTPIQNSTLELWSLLNFVAPQSFPSRDDFLVQYGTLHDSTQVQGLHRLLKPFLLRRLKEDVEKSIPPKEETIIEVEMTMFQKQYYRAIFDRNRTFLTKGVSSKNTPNLINVMIQLRKVCNHPYLVKGCEETDTRGVTNQDEINQKLIMASGKLVLLDKLLPKLKAGGHRVLIFSQMVKILDLLESYLMHRGYLFERLDGGVRGNERQSAIDRFCAPNSDRFVFLLCTRAGGVGINLAAADTVIIYDSDWNPQNDIQAQARCHRIGQTQEVKVYRLICAKTYERYMLERASKKLALDQAVLSNMGVGSDPKKELGDKDIDNLLKYGAYAIFNENEEEMAQSTAAFQGDDIDHILERSTKIVWNANGQSQAGATFSKASYQAAEQRVDVTSPQFWDRILPEERNARWFQQRLEEWKEWSQNPEHTRSFFQNLTGKVNEVTRQWQDTQGVRPQETDTLIQVLLQCQELQSDANLFNEHEGKQIATWLQDLAHPRRKRRQVDRPADLVVNEDRRATTVASTTSQTSYADPDFDDEQAEKDWSRPERIKFHEAFFALPDSRWHWMQQKSLQNKTLEELYAYARGFLKHCAYLCEPDDKVVFMDNLRSLVPPTREEIEAELEANGGQDLTVITKPTYGDPAYKKIILRKLKGWIRRLKMFQTLKAVFEDFISEPITRAIPPATKLAMYADALPKVDFDLPNKKLASWWTSEDDKSLLLGVVKHGYGAYATMKEDPALNFSVNKTAFLQAEREYLRLGKPAGARRGGDDDEEDEEETPAAQMAAIQQSLADPKAPTPQLYTGTQLISIKSIATNADAAQPGQLKLVVSLSRSPAPVMSLFPDRKTLHAHLKFLVDQVDKFRRAQSREMERKKKQQDKVEQKKSNIAAKQREKSQEWTKREEKELKAAIMTLGGGYWNVLKLQAALDNKTEDQVKEYFFNLMAYCRKISVGHELPPADANAIPNDNNLLAGGTEFIGTNVPQLPLTPQLAVKLLRRVQLFEEMRTKVLTNDKLPQLLMHSRNSDVPVWWRVGLVDKDLLESVVKYGIGGPEQWEDFLEPDTCPLLRSDPTEIQMNPGLLDMKRQWFLNFLQDKPPLVSRLTHLVNLAMQRPDMQPIVPMVVDINPPPSPSPSTVQRVKRKHPDTPQIEDGDFPAAPESKRQKIQDGDQPAPKQNPPRAVPRDPTGKPILPITAKGATILELGTVVWDRPSYHSRSYIWPVGFKSSRKMPSIKNQTTQVQYVSEIVDNGEEPGFRVTPSDAPELSITSSTSSRAWAEMLRQIKRKQSVSISGPEMYAFSDPTVKMLIQELPNSNLCTNYIWQQLEPAASPAAQHALPPPGPPKGYEQQAPPAADPLQAIKQIEEQIKQLESLTRSRTRPPNNNAMQVDPMDTSAPLHPPLNDFTTEDPGDMLAMWDNY